ncbi:hypothetical protein KAR91_14935 [Candidatus Pacearchaeota archaeon]|nr:hypothetical protein [Candidatus Pacearchaeota archaeon]
MEKYLREASRTHRNNIRAIKAHGEVLDFVTELAKKYWSSETAYTHDGTRHYTALFSNTFTWDHHVDLSCYLSKIDSLKNDIVELLEAILDAGWEASDERLEQASEYKVWTFHHPDKKYLTVGGSSRSTTMKVFFYFGQSENCRVVGTGEFEQIEKTEVICGD